MVEIKIDTECRVIILNRILIRKIILYGFKSFYEVRAIELLEPVICKIQFGKIGNWKFGKTLLCKICKLSHVSYLKLCAYIAVRKDFGRYRAQ